MKRIAIGDPEILEVSSIDNGRGILLVGKNKGTTDLLIWEGKELSQINVHVRETPSPGEEITDERILMLLKTLGVKNPEISHIDDKKVVTGEGNNRVLERATAILTTMENILPAFKEEEKRKKEIIYDLKFLEISKGSLKSLGIKWPDSFEIDATLERDGENSAVIESSFGLMIKNLISNGKAKVLANPVLVCEEGEKSSFLAGGEIPVVIIGDEKREVIWKKYGIILQLANGPEENGIINTTIEAEVSTIDHSTGTSDIPGFITRRVKTSFSLEPGQTVVLSGLVKNEMTKDVSKLPLLGHLPIIGELFKSRNFRNNHTELIITITPTILTKEISKTIVSDFQKKFEKMDEKMKFKLLD